MTFPTVLFDPDLPPPENPFFVEEHEVPDDAYPDPPVIPAGWVHIRSECIPPCVGSPDIFGEENTSLTRESASILLVAMGGAGRVARKAAKKAGPVLGLALDKTRDGASWAAGSMRQLNENTQIIDRTLSSASSAAQTMKDFKWSQGGAQNLAKKTKKGWSATIELARRSSEHSPPRPYR